MNKKELVVKYRALVELACRMHNLRNCFRTKTGSGNQVQISCALMKKVSVRISGTGNRVYIGDFSTLKDTSITIHGDNNTVFIGPWSTLIQADLFLEDDGGSICLGEHTRILGSTQLSAIEGTSITTGKDCLFSSGVHFRTGDSHSILDMQGRRINASEDIRLGDHVWVGTKVTCLKGTQVPDHSIIGACSLVTKAFDTPNCVLAGVPAKVVKTGVDWSMKRIPLGETAADFTAQEANQ